MSFVKAIAVSVLLHACLYAQSNRVIRGEVLSSGALVGTGYVAQIYDQTGHRVIETVQVSSLGRFEFRDVGSGSYTLQISTETGEAVTSAPLDPSAFQAPLQIRLPESRGPKPIAGVVSVAALQHPPARKAFDEMVKAQKYARASDAAHAMEHLQKAIKISPDYADAHTNLGGQYIRAGRYEEGLAEYRTVLALAPATPPALCNLSIALLATRHVQESEEAARSALALDSRNPTAHFVLGRALFVDPSRRLEARRHFQIAAPAMPQAATFLSMF